jgi:hypothetical protein
MIKNHARRAHCPCMADETCGLILVGELRSAIDVLA